MRGISHSFDGDAMSTDTDIQRTAQENLAAFLDRPHLARLATAGSESLQPHVVPVWYLWDGTAVWISSYRSTRKIKELTRNPKCAVLIDAQESQNGLTAVLFEGQAELVTQPLDFLQEMTKRIYIRYLGDQGVLAADPQEWIHSPENMLIKLIPSFTRTW